MHEKDHQEIDYALREAGNSCWRIHSGKLGMSGSFCAVLRERTYSIVTTRVETSGMVGFISRFTKMDNTLASCVTQTDRCGTTPTPIVYSILSDSCFIRYHRINKYKS